MTVECRTSYETTVVLLLACPLLLLLAALGMTTGWRSGWIAVAVAPLGFVYWLRALFRPNPQVVLDQFSIEDRRLGVGPIPWSEINARELHEIYGNVALSIERVVGSRASQVFRVCVQAAANSSKPIRLTD